MINCALPNSSSDIACVFNNFPILGNINTMLYILIPMAFVLGIIQMIGGGKMSMMIGFTLPIVILSTLGIIPTWYEFIPTGFIIICFAKNTLFETYHFDTGGTYYERRNATAYTYNRYSSTEQQAIEDEILGMDKVFRKGT